MTKIALVGAGSMEFATKLIGDVLLFPDLAGSELALMDVDERRLARTTEVAEAMVEKENATATVESTTDREAALSDADYVVTMVNVGGVEPFENEIRIPEKYGVEQAIGDTHGPGGVFRGLRTIPTIVDIARDMERLCPDALLINYSNPLAMVCQAVDRATSIDVVGLCHSVPSTIKAIADYVGAPAEDLDHVVAGINHMSWVLSCERDGDDVYPELRDAVEDEAIYRRDTVRFEMMKHFGYFPTESSHHVSEYVPYFRTDEETIAEMNGTGWAGRMPTGTYLDRWTKQSRARDEAPVETPSEVVVERSDEYAAPIIHSVETGEYRRISLNVSNANGVLDPLPESAFVEVPCAVDGSGIHPCSVGPLPAHLASLNRPHTVVQDLTVTAALDGDREALHRAVKLDPLTAAALSLDEIHEMTEELLEANTEYLPDLH